MPTPRNLRPRSRLLAAVLVMVLAAGACGVEGNDGKRAVGGPTSNPDIVGSEVSTPSSTTSPPTTTTTPPPTDLQIEGVKDSSSNDTIANAIEDLQTWWAGQYPKVYGEPYEPVTGGLYAVDSSTDPKGIPCAPDDITQVLDNAYYCPGSDAIVWDQERLMPYLEETYGAFTPAVAIAHEWGHAVQERARFDAPTVISEQQADCFAGAWVKHERVDEDARFRLTTDDLDQALAGLLYLRDAPGSSADDPNAHGSGFDRVRAFQEGFESGAERCAEYQVGDPRPFQFPFTRQEDLDSGGDMPLTGTTDNPGIDTLAFVSLDAYWNVEFPKIADGTAWEPMKDPIGFSPADPPECNGEKVTQYLLFVCIPDRYVGYDREKTIPATYDEGGDFAVATLFATQYGLDIEAQLEVSPESEVVATLQADCYAGSWAASILPGVEQPTEDGIVLSPGDLDEAVGVLLKFRSDAERSRQGPAFDRVRAFGVGVTKGASACSKVTPS